MNEKSGSASGPLATVAVLGQAPRLVVGLTGGIASGKSTVERLFAALGVPVIDADRIAHDLVRPGQPGLDAVVAHFGRQVLTADGALDRAQLAARVFADPAERRRLEGIVHPLVRLRIQASIEAERAAPYVLVSIPLLLESGQQDLVDRILVVDLPETIQRQRLQARDRRPPEQVDAILAAQADRHSRLRAADDLIDNSGPTAALAPQVNALHRSYLSLAQPRQQPAE